MIRASSCWTVEGGEDQTTIRYGRERSGKPTFWLRSGLPGDRNCHGVDGEGSDGEEGESSFGEHDGVESREEGQITTAPGLEFGR